MPSLYQAMAVKNGNAPRQFLGLAKTGQSIVMKSPYRYRSIHSQAYAELPLRACSPHYILDRSAVHLSMCYYEWNSINDLPFLSARRPSLSLISLKGCDKYLLFAREEECTASRLLASLAKVEKNVSVYALHKFKAFKEWSICAAVVENRRMLSWKGITWLSLLNCFSIIVFRMGGINVSFPSVILFQQLPVKWCAIAVN